MKYVAWLILIFLVVGTGVYLASDDFDRAGLVGGSSGYIESGTKFGISIGMPVSDARQHLASRGLQPIDLAKLSAPPRSCLGRIYGPDRHVEGWEDPSWHRGVICVSSTQGKVASVEWLFDPIETW